MHMIVKITIAMYHVRIEVVLLIWWRP